MIFDTFCRYELIFNNLEASRILKANGINKSRYISLCIGVLCKMKQNQLEDKKCEFKDDCFNKMYNLAEIVGKFRKEGQIDDIDTSHIREHFLTWRKGSNVDQNLKKQLRRLGNKMM